MKLTKISKGSSMGIYHIRDDKNKHLGELYVWKSGVSNRIGIVSDKEIRVVREDSKHIALFL